MQAKAASQAHTPLDLPILHLPQLLGLAMGLDTRNLGLKRHLISPESALAKIGVGL
jgi:succinate dehydrogenase / fumarate reductase cytochrome b subunit